jgi:alanyl-tRNA synthetase
MTSDTLTKPHTLNAIRTTFLDYFAKAGHTVVPSSPLVPKDDPTLLFTNAGMVPFKNLFTGLETRDYTRAASSQKCVRAGGKHNDLDNVGYTARHHTFFEMLGNFSFGDYFKETAIELAWTLITKDFGLNPDKLLVTVFSADEEAAILWKKIAGLPDKRIIRIGTADNFWSMGDTGPCGPCSEIFYDHGDSVAGGPPGSPDQDGDRFVEIWNLVFMQFEQLANGERVYLPKPSIDTGMGLERIAAVMQGVHNNYDTDLFQSLIRHSVDLTGVKAEGGALPSHRVIADHLRAASFLIADGVTPSNEGRGYVLRRIMRRAMRHAHILGATTPLMHRLAPTLVGLMGDAYPELGRAAPVIVETLRAEEERFRQTLGRGLALLDEATATLTAGQSLDGEVAFKLYDTYGFPLDLTQDTLRAKGIAVDTDGFEIAMNKQREMARANWSGSGDKAGDDVWFAVRAQHGATAFTGYDALTATATVQAIVVDGQVVDAAQPGQKAQIVTNATPFYAMSGGQAGDTGVINGVADVLDCQKAAGDLHVHHVMLKAALRVGQTVTLSVDEHARTHTRANHSAAHLVHKALWRVLGPHVAQKGQMVDADRMRFDFSHGQGLTADELTRIEAEVNAVIRQNIPAKTEVMSPDAAMAAGAIALFGEKYGDSVRVMTLGQDLDDPSKPYSVELCGGTHVARTGDIALFKVVSEGAVAAGIRRIEALTGEAARQYLLSEAWYAKQAADILKTQTADVPSRLDALLSERKALERQISDLKKKLATGGAGGPAVETINGVTFLGAVIEDVSAKDLRDLIEQGKSSAQVVVYVSKVEGKAAIAVGSSVASINAADLVKAAVVAMGGQGGGGRADFAQGGAPDDAHADAGLTAIKNRLG